MLIDGAARDAGYVVERIAERVRANEAAPVLAPA
jgi:hypothetical protein